METKGALTDHAVLIEDGRITWVGPSDQAALPDAAVAVDLEGRTLLPGLTDIHVHLRHDDELDLYLWNGVTTVANLSGTPDHLETRRRIAAGELRGPRIFTTGPTIDGDPPRNSRFQPIGDPADAEALVASHIEAGYDLLKIYDLIELEPYRAIVDAAERRGVAVVGHVPKAFGLEPTLVGHDMIAHAEEYFYTFFENEDDATRIPEAVRLTAEAGVAVCPNIGFIRRIIEQAEDIDSVLALPEVRYVRPSVLVNWLPETNRYVGRPQSWLDRNRRMYPHLVKLTKALHEADVVLLTGTDASVPGGVPGFAVHEELADLSVAGLSNFEALETVTINPGRWLEEHVGAEPAGRIAVGTRADLVIVDGDPLTDLDALKTVLAIAVGGKWIDGAVLGAEVEARAESYEEQMAGYYDFRNLVEQREFDQAERLARENAASTDPVISENMLNNLGYGFLYGEEDPETAIGVFQVATRVWPESSNTWDSLGEGYMEAGDFDRAIENYQKSLELDPGNTNAVEMIERMRRGDVE
jgi:imidazolonepropionase-like amidohydrolase